MQADLLTLAALGCHAVTVTTAVTVQDTQGVREIQPLQAGLVDRQAGALLEEFAIAAFKLGALVTREIAIAVARWLQRHPGIPVVLDPVLASGRGDRLADPGAIAAIRDSLLPTTTVLTPNSIEARQLLDERADAPLADCARRLAALGARYVLVTGTHESTPEVINSLYDANALVRADRWPRLPGSYHGSGCTLASALAARLAHGESVAEAARVAQHYTWRTLQGAFRPTRGQHLPDRLCGLRSTAS